MVPFTVRFPERVKSIAYCFPRAVVLFAACVKVPPLSMVRFANDQFVFLLYENVAPSPIVRFNPESPITPV